ncbi:hypothetical protein C8R42DRAFT_679656 [Lentinula raphanica]|nr:hypothetical protein C8R42DRAFT_679656 [Lentinula raphanica]
MTPSPLNLTLNHQANASVYTLATVNDEQTSAHAPLLTPSTPSYGATMPRSPGTARSSRKLILNATLKMAAIFLVSTVILGTTLWLALPTLEEDDRPMLRIPKSFEQLQELNSLLKKYRDIYPYRIVICYIIVYLFLQAFSLPGSMYLSILGGAVWGVARHLESMSARVQRNKANLISFLIVLRIAPLPPHWVVNVVAPHVGISIPTFWISTALGIFGVTVIHTTIGGGLDEMTSADDFHLISWKNFLGLSAIVLGVMIPVGLRYWFKRGGVTADIEGQDEESPVSGGMANTPRSALSGSVYLYDEEDEEEDQILAVGATRLANKSKDADSRTQLLASEDDLDEDDYTSEDDDGDIILEAGPSLNDSGLKSPKPLDAHSSSSIS